nr:visinin-like protein 1 isoform X3 [Desmodus rotundus]
MATSEVESGFDVVPVAPEPSFIPLSQAAAFIASQRRISDFSRRGQDLLERTPWSNISEILFKAGVCHGAAGSLNHFPRIQKLPVQRPHFRKQQRSSRASGIGRRRARQRGLRSCAGGPTLSIPLVADTRPHGTREVRAEVVVMVDNGELGERF